MKIFELLIHPNTGKRFNEKKCQYEYYLGENLAATLSCDVVENMNKQEEREIDKEIWDRILNEIEQKEAI